MIQIVNGEVEVVVYDFMVEEFYKGMKLKYRYDNSEYFRDNFVFIVFDGRYEVKKFCNILIRVLNDEGLEIIKNVGLQLDYGDFVMILSVLL